MNTKQVFRWAAMISRCHDPENASYARYGGRGIRVCERWHDFRNFCDDMGDCPAGLSLDRIDNDGHYEPGNCRWADRVTQSNNRSSNRIVEHLGRHLTLAEWERETGGRLQRTTLGARLRSGMSVAEAIARPVNQPNLWTYRGRTQSIHAWSLEIGMPYGVLLKRCRRGWTAERAIETIAIPRFDRDEAKRIWTYRGRTRSVSAWAAEMGVCHHALLRRFRLGWSAERALETPVTRGPDLKRVDATWTYRGRTQAVRDWAREMGMSYNALMKRFRIGWSADEALETPLIQTWQRSNSVGLLTYRGRTQSLPAWAREIGINYSTLLNRHKLGWSVDRIMETPVLRGGRSPSPRRLGARSVGTCQRLLWSEDE